MAIQQPSYTTYKALTYGQVAARYGFTLKDSKLKDVYMPWNYSIETYPFGNISGFTHELNEWVPPSHIGSRDLVTEDFEHVYDFIAINIPSGTKGFNTTRTFKAYLVHSSYYNEFVSNYGNISTDDLNNLRISRSTTDFNAHLLTLSNLYWWRDGKVERLYTKYSSYTTMYLVSADGKHTKTTNTLYNKMKGQYDPGFSNIYNSFFTHSTATIPMST